MHSLYHSHRATGLCICRNGFTGRACERMSCPSDCNDHGQCMSMAEAAAAEDGNRLVYVSSYDAWDAGMIFVSVVVPTGTIQASLCASRPTGVLSAAERENALQ